MNSNVNLKLKSLRVMHDLTQEELAQILEMHEVTYNRKEKGLSKFNLDEAKKISNYFGETIEVIFFS